MMMTPAHNMHAACGPFEVHGPWILVEFSGLLLEIATIAFVF
jgi:hypothetical protein